MNLIRTSYSRSVSSSACARIAALSLAWLLAGSSFAEVSYLRPGQPNGAELLGPPPLPGSAEEAADLASVRAVFHARTPAERDRALTDSTLSFSLFSPAIGPEFNLAKLPKTQAVLEKVKRDIQEAIDLPKNHFQRKRPYQLDDSLGLGKPEPSFGYPSGHSIRGTVYAALLAELFTDKKEAILAIGRDIGWDRVLIGKHFPTDIYAGRVVGQAIVRELKTNPSFQRDFSEARAEVSNLHAEPALSGSGK